MEYTMQGQSALHRFFMPNFALRSRAGRKTGPPTARHKRNKKNMEEKYLAVPRSKPVKKYKARVAEYENGVKIIAPQAEKGSNRRLLKQKGNSSFYKSEGEKESSYSIHINVPANCPDPVAVMQEQFNELVKGELKSEPRLAVKGKLLYDEEMLQVYLNKTRKTVVIMTTLNCGPTIERELLGLQGSMARIIAQYYSDIIKVFNSVRKEDIKPLTDEEIIDRV